MKNTERFDKISVGENFNVPRGCLFVDTGNEATIEKFDSIKNKSCPKFLSFIKVANNECIELFTKRQFVKIGSKVYDLNEFMNFDVVSALTCQVDYMSIKDANSKDFFERVNDLNYENEKSNANVNMLILRQMNRK